MKRFPFLASVVLGMALLASSQGCMTAMALIRPSALKKSHDLPWYFVTENAAGGVVGYLVAHGWKGALLGFGVGAVVSVGDFFLCQAVLTSQQPKCPIPAGPPPKKERPSVK